MEAVGSGGWSNASGWFSCDCLAFLLVELELFGRPLLRSTVSVEAEPFKGMSSAPIFSNGSDRSVSALSWAISISIAEVSSISLTGFGETNFLRALLFSPSAALALMGDGRLFGGGMASVSLSL